MEVFFVKLYDRAGELHRYVPILKEDHQTEEEAVMSCVEGFEGEEPYLDNVDTDKLFIRFLSYYNIELLEENELDEELRVYRLKKGCYYDFPRVIASVWGAQSSCLRLTEETDYLESHPYSGRYREFIVFEGKFSFNNGNFVNANWLNYDLNPVTGQLC